MFVHKVLFEFLEFKHPRLLLVSPSDTGKGGLLGVKFLVTENWCGRVHFGGRSPEWRVLAKFSVQHWYYLISLTLLQKFTPHFKILDLPLTSSTFIKLNIISDIISLYMSSQLSNWSIFVPKKKQNENAFSLSHSRGGSRGRVLGVGIPPPPRRSFCLRIHILAFKFFYLTVSDVIP